MSPDILALLIPISAIVLGIGSGMLKMVLKSQERRIELRMLMQNGPTESVHREIAALRAELASLRDTSTQFDVSLEHTVQRLEERLARIETRPNASESNEQRLGIR